MSKSKFLKKLLLGFYALFFLLLSFLLKSNFVFASDKFSDKMKGVWVSTVYCLDWPNKYTVNPETFKKQIDAIIDNSKKMGMNTIFLQVRPCSDAFYQSDYYPWSKYLTGIQGLAPKNNFDPLKYWVEQSHLNGLELHAWINPFRITVSGEDEFKTLALNNPAKMHPDWIVKHNGKSYTGNYFFDPAIPQVRELIINGAVEIVKKYDVDGIHLDDYFYPGKDFDDKLSFAKYGAGKKLDDFRRDNINKLIRGLGKSLHALNPKIKFGVSPFAIWANSSTEPNGSKTNAGCESYSNLYADTVYWVEENLVDYIAPQIYWHIGYDKADYKIVLDWWVDLIKDKDVKLYVGMADYKAVLAKSTDDVWYGNTQIKKQLDLNKGNSFVNGEIHFRYKLINDNPFLKDFYVNYYAAK